MNEYLMKNVKKMKKKNKPVQKVKITPSVVIGMLMGLSLISFGLYEAVGNGRTGAYYISALGVVFLVTIGSSFIRR